MPPKHNLRAQINWLLAKKPFIPPDSPLVAYDTDVPEISTTTPTDVSQPSLNRSFPEPVSNNAHVPVSAARATTDPKPLPTRAATHTVDIHKPILEQADDSEMARLRATPGSRRPRLILAGVRSFRQAQASSPSDKRVPEDPTPTSVRRTVSKQPTHTEDIEAIDLTSPRAAAVHKKGKKRTSEEFEEDWKQHSSPRPAKAISTVDSADENEDFAHIDELSTVPESPPPPYSTTLPTSRAAHTRQLPQPRDPDIVDDDLSLFPLSDDDIFMPDAEIQATPSNRKRKSLGETPSELPAPARKIGKQTRSPSPKKIAKDGPEVASDGNQASQTQSRKDRAVIMDSEDDEFLN